MGWGAVIAGAIAIAGGIWQAEEAKKAAGEQEDDARKIAAENALAIRMENMEIARRHLLKTNERDAVGRTMAGASGLSGLSHQRHMERLKKEASIEADWIRRSSVLQQEKEISYGRSQAAQARAYGRTQELRATGRVLQGVGSVVQGIDNWINQ